MKKGFLFIFILLISSVAISQNCLYFDGNVSSNYIDCGTDASLNITGSITVEAWINVDATTFKGWRRIVEKDWASSYFLGSGDGTNDFSIAFSMDANGNVSNVLQTGSNVIAPNVWNHVAGVWDGVNLYIYVNGNLEASMPWNNTVTGTSNSLEIGRYIGGGSYYFRGNIDEVRIWNVARTPLQLQEDMHRELINPAAETNLVAYYQFNQENGFILPDISNNSNNGTLMNMNPATDWVSSTAPIPYYSVLDGDWNVDNTWASGQMAPVNNWSRTFINHNVHLKQDQTLKELVINGSLIIDPGYELTMDGDITNYAGVSGIVLEADASGMSSLLHNNTGIEGTVEEYIVCEQWHLVSPPVTASTINTYFNTYLTQYIEPSDTWEYLVNPTTTPLLVTQGYGVWASNGLTGSTTVSFNGALNNGDYTISSLNYTPSSTKRGFNLIGNPFPSSLDWNTNWTSNNVDATVYFYNGVQYVNWNRAGFGTATNGHIPPTQGFFILANSAAASITLPQSERVHGTQAFYKDVLNHSVNLSIEGNGYSDKIILAFNEKASNEYDCEYDALDLRGIEAAPQLYSMGTSMEYSVNVLSELNGDRIIPIGLETGNSGIYSMCINEYVFDENRIVLLEDIKENTFLEIELGSIYHFSANPGDDAHRFNIHFKDAAFDMDDSPESDMIIYAHDGNLIVRSYNKIKANVKIYNVMGQLVQSEKMNNEQLVNIKCNNGPAYYIVEVQKGDQLIIQKVFLK